jgi:hypothetical protein
MASDLKAVVEITADTKGLVTGIAGATKSISEGTSQIAEMFKFHALKKGLELAKAGFEMVGKHYEELYNTAVTYSPAAAMANNNMLLAKQRADQLTAAAAAPGAIQVANLEAQMAGNTARRNVRDADNMNTGQAGYAATKLNFGAQADMLTEALGNVMAGNFGGAWDSVTGLFDAQNYVYADQAKPGRGMPGSKEFEEATQHLAAIRESMGGQ